MEQKFRPWCKRFDLGTKVSTQVKNAIFVAENSASVPLLSFSASLSTAILGRIKNDPSSKNARPLLSRADVKKCFSKECEFSGVAFS
jgi:hypothetical protein